MGESIAVILFTAAGFLAIVVSLAVKHRYASRITAATTAAAAMGGFLIYGYGFSQQTDFLLLAVMRAVMGVLGMFLGRNDFSAVNGTPLFQSYVSQFLFWLAHFLALYSTASAALTTIGAGALRRLRLWLACRKDITLLYGVNPDSVSFGKRLMDAGVSSLLYVDDAPASNLAASVAAMGSVLDGEPNALTPDEHFLRKLRIRPGKKHLTLYALHKDAAQNLRYATALLDTLKQARIRPHQTSLSIFGAEDADGRHLQAYGETYGYGNVAVFDDASLAARLLIQEHPPCDSVCFDETGRATEDFEALVIGFGQVAQAVLRHLVMHGQFEGSHFRLSVFAPNCQQVNGWLLSYSHALTRNYDISFHPYDARSAEMYQFLDLRKNSLKYIVVCTGDAKLNREISEEIGRYLARIHCAAPVHQCSYQGITSPSEAGLPPKQKGLYTPEVLCTQKMDQMAMALNQHYCGDNGHTPEENWMLCDYFSRMSNRASADFIPALLRAAGKTPSQALAGEWDLPPSLLENLSRTEHLRWCAFHYVMGYDVMDEETFSLRCRQYQAQVASEGQSSLRIGKDSSRRLHACLIPWEQLDELSAAENAVTGRNVDYKALDRSNVLALPEVLSAGQRSPL